MNDDARDDAIDQPASLNNESTPDAAAADTAPTSAAAAAATIVPDTHIPP